jgi:hypothetical protein
MQYTDFKFAHLNSVEQALVQKLESYARIYMVYAMHSKPCLAKQAEAGVD